MAMREGGRDYVEGGEEEGGDPVGEELDDEGAEEFDGYGMVRRNDGCPVRLDAEYCCCSPGRFLDVC